MAELLLLTTAPENGVPVVPALALLHHHVSVAAADNALTLERPEVDVVVVDGRTDLVTARNTCQALHTIALEQPVLLLVADGGLAVVSADWFADDIVAETAGPAEFEARLRLLIERFGPAQHGSDHDRLEVGDLTIDSGGYTARLRGSALDLTFKEFELLRYLCEHLGRVFTRAQLLQEVWGYDYFGGTRTVDVHIRRLRAKLSPDHDQLISTVRGVGYRMDAPPAVEAHDQAGASEPTEGNNTL